MCPCGKWSQLVGNAGQSVTSGQREEVLPLCPALMTHVWTVDLEQAAPASRAWASAGWRDGAEVPTSLGGLVSLLYVDWSESKNLDCVMSSSAGLWLSSPHI